MTHPTTMLEKAKSILGNAYAPYSQFQVACCIRSKSSQYYTGCNVENASYGLTLCAEASAISQMVSSGETNIVEVLILIDHADACSPCGACRQRLSEFANATTLIHLATASTGIQQTFSLAELLPHRFSKNNFIE